MYTLVVVDNGAESVVTVRQIAYRDVLEALQNSPKGTVVYVVDANGDPGLADDLAVMDYDAICEILQISEDQGMLVAKFDNTLGE